MVLYHSDRTFLTLPTVHLYHDINSYHITAVATDSSSTVDTKYKKDWKIQKTIISHLKPFQIYMYIQIKIIGIKWHPYYKGMVEKVLFFFQKLVLLWLHLFPKKGCVNLFRI